MHSAARPRMENAFTPPHTSISDAALDLQFSEPLVRRRDKFAELPPFFAASLAPPRVPSTSSAAPVSRGESGAELADSSTDSPPFAAAADQPPPLHSMGMGVQFSARVRRLIPPWSRWNRCGAKL